MGSHRGEQAISGELCRSAGAGGNFFSNAEIVTVAHAAPHSTSVFEDSLDSALARIQAIKAELGQRIKGNGEARFHRELFSFGQRLSTLTVP
jgi:hypothetical protein